MITKQDRQYFHWCYDAAKEWSLNYEFLYFYKKFRKEGLSIERAAAASANEWDI